MAAFSPDGTSIASFSSNACSMGTVRVWDTKTGAERFPPLEQDGIHGIAFSFNGLRIVSVSRDGLLRMWDAMSGVEILPPVQFDDVGGSKQIVSGAFSADGMKFVWSVRDHYIRIMHFDPHTQPRQMTAFFSLDLLLSSLSFSPDGGRIVSGFDDGSIQVYDVALGLELVSTMRGHSGYVRSVAFSPDGTRIVSGSSDKTIRVWSIESGLEIFPALRAHNNTVTSAVFSPDGTIILSSSMDGTIRLWDAMLGVETQDVLRQHESSINCVVFSPDGRSIVSASHDCTVRVWKLSRDSSTIPDVRKDRATISSVALSPDGTKVVSGSTSGIISIWDAKSGTETLPALQKHKGEVCSIIFTPDGTLIFSCSYDRTICAFDVMTGIESFPAIRNSCTVRSITICPMGNRIASGDDNGAIRIWDAKLGTEIEFPNISPVRQHIFTRILSRRHYDCFSIRQTYQSMGYKFRRCVDAIHNELLGNRFASTYGILLRWIHCIRTVQKRCTYVAYNIHTGHR